MSSPRYATPLRLTLKHSPRLRAIYLIFITLCVVSLLAANLLFEVRLLLLVLLVSVSAMVWRQRVELGGEAAKLVLRPNGSWLLLRGEREEKLQLNGQSTVSQAVTILVFKGEGRGRQFVLWRQELGYDVYRRLQVYLRLYSSESVG